jgi:hypothetical protein
VERGLGTEIDLGPVSAREAEPVAERVGGHL